MKDKALQKSVIGLIISAILFCAALPGLIIAFIKNPIIAVHESLCTITDVLKDSEQNGLRIKWECYNCTPTSYQVFRRVNGENSLAAYKGVNYRNKYFVDKDVSDGNLYEYNAAAFDNEAESGSKLSLMGDSLFYYYDADSEETVLENYIPKLNIDITDEKVRLSWTYTPNVPISGYRVERYDGSEWKTAAKLSGNILTYDDVPTAGAKYRLYVYKGSDENNAVLSMPSEEVSSAGVPVSESMTYITNVTVENGNLLVKWHTPDAFPTSYQIMRGINGAEVDFYEDTVPEEPFFVDTDINDSTLYCYVVAAYDSRSEYGKKLGKKSQPVYYFYSASETAVNISEAAPEVISSVNDGSGVTIKWEAPTNTPLNRYRIEKETENGWEETAAVSADTFEWSGSADASKYRVIGVFETLSQNSLIELHTLPAETVPVIQGEGV